ncbi:hypothetical protein [Virgisporangium aliadipatigenens]|nr:hypothetical protein [Virgisporangium aliadipatigenens]
MTCESGDCPHSWHYAPHRSLRGALQRGRGLAVARLRDRPEDARLVYECTGRDARWDWQVDARCTYLARLLRDLRLDPAPLVAQLRACGPYLGLQPDPTDDDNQFDLAVGILATLARAGEEQPRAALRGYVREGVRWLDALTALADQWPVEWWDDLWETAAGRIDAADPAELWPDEQPWRSWRGRDRRLDAALASAVRCRPAARAHRTDLATASDAQLLALLHTSTDTGTLNLVLGRIRHQGRPIPEILDLVDRLAPARPAGLFGALRALGPQVTPPARAWAADPDHPLFRDAPHLLAAHGDEQDIPVLLAALDLCADDWCGYDVLTEGLARILAGSPSATHTDARTKLVRRLKWLTVASPHSYERASYLRSLLLLDPNRTMALLPIHLLDCEPQVRLLAAAHTPLTDDAHRWLTELRDDPIEEEEIRSVAAARLSPS